MNQDVVIDYTNHRGERSKRTVKPIRIWFGHTDYHQDKQWLMDAWDREKQANRTFALKDVHDGSPA